MNRCRSSILFILAAILVALPARAQNSVFSFVDAQGVRVLTNIPPKNQVQEEVKAGPAPQAPAAPSLKPRPGLSYDALIEKYATQYRMDPSLIHSMIVTESGFNHRAVSAKGALGLMQLMPATARNVGVRNAFDPEENIRGGVKHMRTLLDTFDNDLPLSLAAYNAGENLVQRIGRVPNIRETRNYVRSITQRYVKNQMRLNSKPVEQPRMFRFQDKNGILHLTNIAPREESHARFTPGQGAESPE